MFAQHASKGRASGSPLLTPRWTTTPGARSNVLTENTFHVGVIGSCGRGADWPLSHA